MDKYGIYMFNSAKQITNTINGFKYVMDRPMKLLKLHTPFLDRIKGHSWYFIFDEEIIIDCGGYIEERCLLCQVYIGTTEYRCSTDCYS